VEDSIRERCYDCLRPVSFCFCDAIPRIHNRTDVLILQHVGERSHPFNTAKIVRKSLRRCQLITDHNQRFGQHPLPIQADAGLLYPSDSAQELTDLPDQQKPGQLVIIDGTWHQAYTIVRDVPQLQTLPRYRISPSSPGRYRIRREPQHDSLSTLEATVAALQALEPDTKSIDQLITAFDRMIEDQLDYPASHAAWRRRKVRPERQRGIPRSLLEDPDRLVIAYGEATPRQPTTARLPVNWFAQRLGTGERLSALLRQPQPLSPSTLAHMRLSAADFHSAVPLQQFQEQWQTFLRPHDTLIVYHERTAHLLRNSGATLPSCVTLKSIFGKWQTKIPSLEALLDSVGLAVPPATGCRAEHRLQMALQIVRHLRNYAAGDLDSDNYISRVSG
jgi:DTW domain-containing protein YfiP